MIQEPLHTIRDPSAVRRGFQVKEVDLAQGKTETEAPESTKNSLSDKISHRKRRDVQQTSSGHEIQDQELERELDWELERDQEVRQEFPPAEFLVFQNQARFPAIDSHVSYETNMRQGV